MIASRLAPKLFNTANAVAAARQMSAVSGPPTVRISFAEKVAHGVVMSVGVLAMPAWVLYHIREYRGLA